MGGKTCCECRKGGHRNIDNDIRLTLVYDPDAARLRLRGYLCGVHRMDFEMDGYDVKVHAGSAKTGYHIR
jgi:hypothetical protein